VIPQSHGCRVVTSQVSAFAAEIGRTAKTPFKETADVVDYGEATVISTELTALRLRVEQLNVELKMVGKPTLDEQTEEALSDLIEQLNAGERENDPELMEIAMEAKREK
jgi:hypothetical protein